MLIKVPPTKSNLFKLEQDLRFAREGYELLDRKREVLVMELMQIVHTIKNLQRRLAGAPLEPEHWQPLASIRGSRFRYSNFIPDGYETRCAPAASGPPANSASSQPRIRCTIPLSVETER